MRARGKEKGSEEEKGSKEEEIVLRFARACRSRENGTPPLGSPVFSPMELAFSLTPPAARNPHLYRLSSASHRRKNKPGRTYSRATQRSTTIGPRALTSVFRMGTGVAPAV